MIPDWDFDALTKRHGDESIEHRALGWTTGTGFGNWTVAQRESPAWQPAQREVEHTLSVTDGALPIVGWGDVTQVAETNGVPSGTDRRLDLENGHDRVLVRQLFGPYGTASGPDAVFEVVCTPTAEQPRAFELLWWEF